MRTALALLISFILLGCSKNPFSAQMVAHPDTPVLQRAMKDEAPASVDGLTGKVSATKGSGEMVRYSGLSD